MVYGCYSVKNIANRWKIFVIYLVTMNDLIHGMKYLEVNTGFNVNMNAFEIQSMQCRSRLTCSVLCDEKECASFLHEDSSKKCRIFSVFMTGDNNVAVGTYYRRSDVEEYTFEVTKCSAEALPSQDTNVALQKDVILSSIFDTRVSPGSLMTDGSRRSTYPCASTKPQQYPEAEVDLGQSFAISAMYIVNRRDCCSERLHDVIIQVGDGLTDLTTVFNHTGEVGADCKIIKTHQQGRYVKMFIDGNDFLTVCELEVYSSG